MKDFNYSAELQKIITTRQLVQVELLGVSNFKVAYLLSADDKFLALAEVSSAAAFAGIILCRAHDLMSISVETLYIGELSKRISGDSLYQQAMSAANEIQEYSIDGFATAMETTQKVVGITFEDEHDIAGRIVAHDGKALALDEYSAESDRRLKRTYLKYETICRLCIDEPWLRTIAQSLVDKNL